MEIDLLQLEVLGLENDVAQRRDWLNPETERLAREAVKE